MLPDLNIPAGKFPGRKFLSRKFLGRNIPAGKFLGRNILVSNILSCNVLGGNILFGKFPGRTLLCGKPRPVTHNVATKQYARTRVLLSGNVGVGGCRKAMFSTKKMPDDCCRRALLPQ